MKKSLAVGLLFVAVICGFDSAAYANDNNGHKEPMPTWAPPTTTPAPSTTVAPSRPPTTNARVPAQGRVEQPRRPRTTSTTVVRRAPAPQAPATTTTTEAPIVTTTTTEAPVVNQSTLDCPVCEEKNNCWPWWWLIVAAALGGILTRILGSKKAKTAYSAVTSRLGSPSRGMVATVGGWKGAAAIVAILGIVAWLESLMVAGIVLAVALVIIYVASKRK